MTVISDGPLKAFDTGVDVERNVVARKGLHVRVHGFFDREAPPSEVPAHEVTVEIQKHDLTAFGRFQDGDGFDFLWPPLDRICDRAFELC